ncbi:MAG: tRNA (adenosine(37)-N6)-dimethylallyltransferase MiaA [Proteobacteria bacterium]|nr:tRNA (adenosine(37)-N6)-dimethylallyltransferase MiaA [Pseudomonadota bacterium]
MTRPPVIFLMGPTACGKTAAACWLVDRFACEIVSVDSALVYRGLNIGTAKPSPALLKKYPHQLIDHCEPTQSYSAGEFRTDALLAIAEIQQRGNMPLLVGGTGLYFRVLESGIAELPDRDAGVRQSLEEERLATSLGAMHARLAAVDPRSAARIHPNDPQRILRALEIYALRGKTMSELLEPAHNPEHGLSICKLVLAPSDRHWLHDRIAKRFHAMLTAGFINEVAALRSNPNLSLANSALRAVGYRAIWRYLTGERTFDEMVSDGIVATRQLAKRQLTWFRRQIEAQWVDSVAVDAHDQLGVALKSHLQYNERSGA